MLFESISYKTTVIPGIHVNIYTNMTTNNSKQHVTMTANIAPLMPRNNRAIFVSLDLGI